MPPRIRANAGPALTRNIDITVGLAENDDNLTPDVKAFGFAADGTFVSQLDLKDGQAILKPGKDSGITQVLVGALPPSFTGPPTLDALKRYRAVPLAAAELAAGKTRLQIDPINWHNWLFVRCPVPGQVLKVESINGVTRELPVCNAVVHVCEVDPILFLLDRLPDVDIARLSRELVDLVETPQPPVPPIPDPGPLRARIEASTVLGRRLDAVALNPQPLPPVASAQLAPAIRSALLAPSTGAIRAALKANVNLLIPNLCWFGWLSPWFIRSDELTTATTDEDGRFNATIYYPRFGDHPDLYFWVEAPVAGVLVTVYRPPIQCHTWWDYPCGTNVTLRVTDPRVQGCDDRGDVLGKVVILRSVGGGVSAGEIVRAADVTREGLSPDATLPGIDSPFGGTLDLRADFGNGLVTAGITHYAWSVRPVGGSDSDWQKLTLPVSRYYETTQNPPEYKALQIGPDPAVPGYFTALAPTLPADFSEWHPIEDHIDQATAYFDTTAVAGGPESSGQYELKLELFKVFGGVATAVNFTVDGIGAFEVDQPAPFGGATIVPVALPPGPAVNDRLFYNASGDVVGIRLVVHVDNRPCSGTINDVTLDLQPAGRCGFLDYTSALSVAHLSFDASQPGGFAQYDFATTRVATGLPSGTVSGNVGDAPTNGFTKTGDTFGKDLTVTTLLNDALPVGEQPCARSAFAEVLHVHASATNGDARLTYLDAPRGGEIGTRAFAIEASE